MNRGLLEAFFQMGIAMPVLKKVSIAIIGTTSSCGNLSPLPWCSCHWRDDLASDVVLVVVPLPLLVVVFVVVVVVGVTSVIVVLV